VETVKTLLAQLQEREKRLAYLRRSNSEFQSLIEELEWAQRQRWNSRAWKLAIRLDDAARRIPPPESGGGRLLRFAFRAFLALPRLGRREYIVQNARLHVHPPGGESGSGDVLVIDHRIPYADRDGGSFRMMEILRSIRRRHHRVTFIPDNLTVDSPYIDDMLRIGIEVVQKPHYHSVVEHLQEHGGDFKLAILSHCKIAAQYMSVVRRLAPRAKIVFDAVDLHFNREEREAEILRDHTLRATAATRKQKELRLVMRADLTFVVSTVEKAILQAENASLNVQVLSNIHSMDETDPAGFEQRRDIVFIGNFEHPPDVDAVLFFMNEVVPRVHDRTPGAIFHVLGHNAPAAIRRLASRRVRIYRHVTDVRPIFDNARVSVAPIRFGAGVKVKLSQSMALGVPTVVTSVAAEGMHLVHEQNAMIADDPDSFAESLVRAWSSPDLWQRLSSNGRQNIRDHFSVAATNRGIDAILEWAGLAPPHAHGRPVSRLSA